MIERIYLTCSAFMLILIIFIIITSACGLALNEIYDTVKDLAIPVRVYHGQSTIDKP